MAEWVTAQRYSKEIIQSQIVLTTLTYQGQMNSYHMFHGNNGSLKLVTFSNQVNLLEYLRSHTGCVFALHLVKDGTYSYPLTIDGVTETYYAIAKAMVIAHGSEDNPRTLLPQSDDKIVIE